MRNTLELKYTPYNISLAATFNVSRPCDFHPICNAVNPGFCSNHDISESTKVMDSSRHAISMLIGAHFKSFLIMNEFYNDVFGN